MPESIFDLDDRLLELMDAVEQCHAEQRDVPAELAAEIDLYLEQHRRKVDSIAAFWRWQESIALVCGKEADRLFARKRTAQARLQRLKGVLRVFMQTRAIGKMDGHRATITFQRNSVASLLVEDPGSVPKSFREKAIVMNEVELEETVEAMPDGPVRDKLRGIMQGPGWEINEAALRLELSQPGAEVPGARLVKGRHVRLR